MVVPSPIESLLAGRLGVRDQKRRQLVVVGSSVRRTSRRCGCLAELLDMRKAVTVVSSEGLRPGAITPGVTRELALEANDATVMRARAEPGASSGWHHHGARDVLGYVVLGRARFEFGPDGAESVDVDAGGFFHVPAGLVHRDINPSDVLQEIVMTVVGSGPLVVNVEGPDA